MLSIGKVGLARDQQLYYEQKVARGREDYYAGRGEKPGRWTGRVARQLGLSGEVDRKQLKAMMDGRHPMTGEELAVRGPRSKTAAFDLTFSAPKSVSVLYAVGDARLAGALVEAHEEAVDAALGYLEREACRVRRGHNGTRAEREAGDPQGWRRARAEPAGGFVAAAYRHRMSRAQDPQLHTHVVCANMAQGRDGRWTALDGTAVYAHAKAAGFLYEAHLRGAVRERLPWAEWGRVRNGIADLVQVPEAVRSEFSQRRRRILEREAELQAAGVAVGHAGRERIVHDTRDAKREVTDSDWRAQVCARAAEHGLGREVLARLTRRPAALMRENVSEGELARQLLSPAGLTAKQNTFRARDVVIAVAEAHGAGATAEEVLAGAERLLADPEVVPVSFGVDRRYTTRELLHAEELIVRHAEQGKDQGAGMLDRQQVTSTLERLPYPLSAEQRVVVLAIAGSGNRIDTVEALAGTGKTTAAGAIRAIYEQAGFRVMGAAPTARAVRELRERAGIGESRTLDAWALSLAADLDAFSLTWATHPGVRRQPAVLVIDEGGMAHTRLAATVIERAMAADVKVIALGDSGQLSSIQAGGWLGALTRRVGSLELREVMRQRDPAERRALARLHRGEPDTYVSLKSRRGELRVFASDQPGPHAERRLIERWTAACERHGLAEAVMVCRDNERRQRLNELARAQLREQGKLGESIAVGGGQWAVGDRVIARRNDRARDLDNGMRGAITSIDQHQGAIVHLDSGDTRHLDVDYLRHHVQHAYALTGHGLQGGTVEWAGVMGQPHDFSRNWAYTALSRAREPTEIFLLDTPDHEEREEYAPGFQNGSGLDALCRIAARMRERDNEDLALEQLEYGQPRTREHEHTHDPGTPEGSPTRLRLYALEQQLRAIHDQLQDAAVKDAHTLARVEETIAAIEREHARDSKPRGWRDRSGHRTRQRLREQHFAELREHQGRLLDRVPDPRAVLERAEQLSEQQRALGVEHRRMREQAISEELATKPPWLEQALGPEPQDKPLRGRWHKTAREIAGHRIDDHITDPHTAFNQRGRVRALQRAIAETRAALGIGAPGQAIDVGVER